MKRYASIIMCLAAAASLHALQPLDNVVSTALHNDPTLRAEYLRGEATVADMRADNVLDGPEADFEHLWGSSTSEKRWNVSVSQEFAYPGLYRARSQAADAYGDAAQVAIMSMVRDNALSIKQMIIDVVNARARLKFYEEVDSNLNHIAELTNRSYALGNVTVLDVRKMQLALLDSRRQITTARAELDALVASLEGRGVTINVDDDMWGAYPLQAFVQPPTSPDAYDSYLVGKASATASQAGIKAIKLQALPTVSLGYVHAYEERTHFNGLSVALRLPQWSQSKRREAARLEAEAVSCDTEAAMRGSMAEAVGLYNSAGTLKESLDGYCQFTGDNGYLDLLKRAFDGGELTVIDYLNEVNLFRTARLDYIDVEYRFNLALARLNRLSSQSVLF